LNKDRIPAFLSAALLDQPGVRHGFFGRDGGISTGAYAGLNTGPGPSSGFGDDKADVAENRRRCAQILAVAPDHLLTAYQTHSSDVLIVDKPWDGAPARADAMVSATPGLAIGALAADCMPFLFLDPGARIIGAAHAGWRGALGGVLENTVAKMASLGADPENIRAAVGPCMRQPDFEVGVDLLEQFVSKYPESIRFFAPGASDDKRQLDLAGFGAWRLSNCGVTNIEDMGVCTLAAPDRYFSYRAVKRAGGMVYGRNLSAIALQ